MLVKPLGLVVKNFVYVWQVVKNKQNLMMTKVSHFESIFWSPELLKGLSHCLHIKKLRCYEVCCQNKLSSSLIILKKKNWNFLSLRARLFQMFVKSSIFEVINKKGDERIRKKKRKTRFPKPPKIKTNKLKKQTCCFKRTNSPSKKGQKLLLLKRR